MQARHNWPKFLAILSYFSFVIVIWLAVDDVRKGRPSKPRTSASVSRLKAPRVALAKSEHATKSPAIPLAATKISNVRIAKWSWLRSKAGSVMTANFALENDNDVAVMDIRISCKLRGKSGTVLDTVNQTIYDEIPPWDEKRFINVDFGFVDEQSDSAVCSVVGVE